MTAPAGPRIPAAKRPAAGSCGCAEAPTSPDALGTAPAGGTCECCLPGLSTAAEDWAALRAAVAGVTDPVVVATYLLRRCRDEHRLLWEQVNDARYRQLLEEHLLVLRACLPQPGTARALDEAVRATLAATLTPPVGLPQVLVAYHVAQLLDATYGHAFVDFFRRHSPYQPGIGDPVPLDSPNLPSLIELSATAPPWRLANRLDETRRLRLAGAWANAYRVVFDYTHYDTVAGVVDADTVIATVHPNRSVAELDVPTDAAGRSFPIRPADPRRQSRVLDRLLTVACGQGASIVVLPELSVDAPLAAKMRRWVQRPDGPRVIVAGSYHHETTEAGVPRRVNTAVTWVRGVSAPLSTDKHSPAEHPIAEDIRPDGWPQLRVYVTADGWHLVVAVCRDLLNPQAVHALTEAGANLVLAPAMSESMVSFGGPVAQLVGGSQALVAVANNPAEWPGDDGLPTRPARGVFGHPGFGQQIRLVTAPDTAPGLALLTVRTGQLRWTAVGDAAPPCATTPAASRAGWSPWVESLRGAVTAPPAIEASAAPAMRPAAVLVLLTDGRDGPQVVLTRRAADLGDYPDRLVFPGGLVEPDDRDITTAALREAEEELGLDPASVDVLGAFPPVLAAATRHLVTPVVALLRAPAPAWTVNQAEVAEVRLLSVSARADALGSEAAEVGPMTAAVLAQLRGLLT